MFIRKAQKNDLDAIMHIINIGRQLQRESGNTFQWNGVYPSDNDVLSDIDRGESYVCVAEETDEGDVPAGTLVATACFSQGEDPNYLEIEGEWLNSYPYMAIHRIASNQLLPGAGKLLMAYAQAHFDNIRIDTHKVNGAMIALVNKFNFSYCGVVYMADGSPREAFHWNKL